MPENNTENLTSLTAYAASHPLSEADVIRMGVEVCRTLEALEAKNTQHGDIRPDHIFVNRQGDFRPGAPGNMSDGTYAAPEVNRGEAYTSAADQYALAAVMYCCLNHNRLPFAAAGADTPASVAAAVNKRNAGENIPAPATGSDALKKAVLRAMSFAPEQRFPSAAEFRKALENCMRTAPAANADGERKSAAPQPGAAPSAIPASMIAEYLRGNNINVDSIAGVSGPGRYPVKNRIDIKRIIIAALCIIAVILLLWYLFGKRSDDAPDTLTTTTSAPDESASVTQADTLEIVDFEENAVLVKDSVRMRLRFNGVLLKSETGEVTWSSDNNGVFTVDENGVITGISVGNARLTATYRGITARKEIAVMETAVSETASLDCPKKDITLKPGESDTQMLSCNIEGAELVYVTGYCLNDMDLELIFDPQKTGDAMFLFVIRDLNSKVKEGDIRLFIYPDNDQSAAVAVETIHVRIAE